MNAEVPVSEKTHEVSIPGHGTLVGHTMQNPATGEDTLHRFARVPFALQPQRFSLCEPIPDEYDYTGGNYRDFGAKCPQPVIESGILRYPESPSDEHIQYANVWVPASDKYKPESGWPVLIYIHGGWLQSGDPNNPLFNIVEAMDDAEFKDKYIFVTIGYRLNMFGFLTCDELRREDSRCTNMGFWDQREGLKWVKKYIGCFGGDAEKITVSGLSAGSYSAFFQLAYEAYHPEEDQFIKQVIFFSNMIYAQPKSVDECREQYDELMMKLGFEELNATEQLAKLRAIDMKELEKLILTLKLHTFRAVTDDCFVSKDILKDINSGEFSKKLVAKGVRIMHGEVNNEGYMYSLLNPPKTFDDLAIQLENYYPKDVVDEVMQIYDVRNQIDESLPTFEEQLAERFGKIVCDGQVYVSSRGFIKRLIDGGFPAKNYFRYRIGFRGEFLNDILDPKVRVTHAYDKMIWFYNLRLGFKENEVECVKRFLQPYLKFLYFEKDIEDWESHDETMLRLFDADGSIEYVADPDWESSLKIADRVYEVQLREY